MNNTMPHAKMAARAHRKGFSPTLPADGWQEDRDGSWEAYKERCVREGATMVNDHSGEYIQWLNDNDEHHRLDGPAYERPDRYKAWCVNNRLHREDGPAIVGYDGYKAWLVNGQRHRLDGPAIEGCGGHNEWYVNGKHHRLDGPARVLADGIVEFYKDGIRYTDITFTQRY